MHPVLGLIFGPMLADVPGEAAQGGEDLMVALVVGPQLEPVAPGDSKRQFQRINGVEPKPFTEQALLSQDVAGCDFELQRGHDQRGDFPLKNVLDSGGRVLIAQGVHGDAPSKHGGMIRP